MAGKEVVFHVDRIYVYLCADGVTRQRCGAHVHQEQKYQPVRVWLEVPVGGDKSCVECNAVGGQGANTNNRSANDRLAARRARVVARGR